MKFKQCRSDEAARSREIAYRSYIHEQALVLLHAHTRVYGLPKDDSIQEIAQRAVDLAHAVSVKAGITVFEFPKEDPSPIVVPEHVK